MIAGLARPVPADVIVEIAREDRSALGEKVGEPIERQQRRSGRARSNGRLSIMSPQCEQIEAAWPLDSSRERIGDRWIVAGRALQPIGSERKYPESAMRVPAAPQRAGGRELRHLALQ